MGKLIAAVLGIILGASIAGCTTLPPLPESDTAKAPSMVDALPEIEAGTSEFRLLPGAVDALRWRLALIDGAESSIDIQYFIWKDDASGSLTLERVLAAADRGVKVRMLIDDMFLSTGGVFNGADEALAAISFHPNVDVRVFNPGKYRDGIMGLAGNFGGNLYAYNRRMHNKIMIFDNGLAISGGRNIGNEYFGLHEPYNFLDLDVLMAGSILTAASRSFDRYWSSESAYPASALMAMDEAGFKAMRKLNTEYVAQQSDLLAPFTDDQRDTDYFLSVLREGMHSGLATYLQDEPVARGQEELRLYDMLESIAEPGSSDFIISSPYLIPQPEFLAALAKDTAAGVSVRILTNSLASNDATPAHSHYKKYRRNILDTGVRLYEFHHHPAGEIRPYTDVDPDTEGFVALHMKAMSVDAERCFIGSLNLDPRAMKVNTENGIYFESPEMCSELTDILEFLIEPANAWSVTQDDRGELQWSSYQGTIATQPAQGLGQRIADFFFRILPLESQL